MATRTPPAEPAPPSGCRPSSRPHLDPTTPITSINSASRCPRPTERRSLSSRIISLPTWVSPPPPSPPLLFPDPAYEVVEPRDALLGKCRGSDSLNTSSQTVVVDGDELLSEGSDPFCESSPSLVEVEPPSPMPLRSPRDYSQYLSKPSRGRVSHEPPARATAVSRFPPSPR